MVCMFHDRTMVIAINIWRDTSTGKHTGDIMIIYDYVVVFLWEKMNNPWNSTENLWHHFGKMKDTWTRWAPISFSISNLWESSDVFVLGTWYGGFHKWGSPKWLVYNGKSRSNGWFGGTPIYGNPHTKGCCQQPRYMWFGLYPWKFSWTRGRRGQSRDLNFDLRCLRGCLKISQQP